MNSNVKVNSKAKKFNILPSQYKAIDLNSLAEKLKHLQQTSNKAVNMKEDQPKSSPLKLNKLVTAIQIRKLNDILAHQTSHALKLDQNKNVAKNKEKKNFLNIKPTTIHSILTNNPASSYSNENTKLNFDSTNNQNYFKSKLKTNSSQLQLDNRSSSSASSQKQSSDNSSSLDDKSYKHNYYDNNNIKRNLNENDNIETSEADCYINTNENFLNKNNYEHQEHIPIYENDTLKKSIINSRQCKSVEFNLEKNSFNSLSKYELTNTNDNDYHSLIDRPVMIKAKILTQDISTLTLADLDLIRMNKNENPTNILKSNSKPIEDENELTSEIFETKRDENHNSIDANSYYSTNNELIDCSNSNKCNDLLYNAKKMRKNEKTRHLSELSIRSPFYSDSLSSSSPSSSSSYSASLSNSNTAAANCPSLSAVVNFNYNKANNCRKSDVSNYSSTQSVLADSVTNSNTRRKSKSKRSKSCKSVNTVSLVANLIDSSEAENSKILKPKRLDARYIVNEVFLNNHKNNSEKELYANPMLLRRSSSTYSSQTAKSILIRRDKSANLMNNEDRSENVKSQSTEVIITANGNIENKHPKDAQQSRISSNHKRSSNVNLFPNQKGFLAKWNNLHPDEILSGVIDAENTKLHIETDKSKPEMLISHRSSNSNPNKLADLKNQLYMLEIELDSERRKLNLEKELKAKLVEQLKLRYESEKQAALNALEAKLNSERLIEFNKIKESFEAEKKELTEAIQRSLDSEVITLKLMLKEKTEKYIKFLKHFIFILISLKCN
jgi:hypothetical protein